MKKRDNIGIELLRIFSMLMIIAWHFNIYSGFQYDNYHTNVLWLNAICGGSTGNAIFIMITGFFLGNKAIYETKINHKKVLFILGNATFYSILFFVLFGNHKYDSFSELVRVMRKVIFPFLYGDYWFIAGYCIIYLLYPFFNILISNLTKKDFEKLLLIFTLVAIIMPSVLGTTESFSNILEIFVYWYFLGAYIGKYELHLKYKIWKLLFVLFVAIALRVVLLYAYYNCADVLGFISWNELVRRMKNSYYLLNILIAVVLLLLFSMIKVNEVEKIIGKIIRIVSTTTMGVYLIHDNPDFRAFWWNYLNGSRYIYDLRLPLISLAFVIVTFAICMIIELVREIVCGFLWQRVSMLLTKIK